ncbi:adenylate/guanylate cyclase domain-containing protein [Roseococcus sp. SYP-B2431]|uniref:adenylate/guanylate cyclase domain-containing protein n=1 Tax=Roseococcus sp. SYP-B2431 TaxID=2496640 RepID=UPI00103BB798|nr:adenylate/guanylate cyclase domain-containing protein [Roseococcus sp. SYP-B2431]TCH98232.1 adenylate/guanylate cyclase domain-containing protein [Roseococcus sp. SYP-B2431]
MRSGALAAALVAGAGLLFAAPVGELRETAADALIRAWPRPDAAAPVLAVAIGEEELAELGPWPWPRATLARLAARLAGDGAAAVVLDVSLVEPAEGDAALRQALSIVPGVVAVLEGALPQPRSLPVATLGAPDLTGLPLLRGVEPQPLPDIPAGLGALPGRTIRSVPMLARVAAPGEPLLPGLALAALAAALRMETLLLREGSPVLIQLGRAGLPLPWDGLLRLDPPLRPVPRLSAAAVLRGEAGEAARGRIVLIGVTAPEAAPLRPSPLGPFTPALHIQAEAVAQLAAGWVPLRLAGGPWTEAATGLLLGLLAAFAVSRAPGPGFLLALLLALAWPMAALTALRLGATLVDPVLPAAAALAGGLAEAAATARRLARERARLLARFAHRLPTGVADQLLAMPEAERLRPELRRVAVVMTDLAGFSAMVRAGRPDAVVATLNAYLAGIEAAVLAQGGTLERLIGDSVLAVFGAPVPQADNAARALAAARAIDAFAEDFRQRPAARALGWGETRIGVTAGEVLAGEVGGSRLTWSVCGDAANLAARLQELGKSLGRRALVAGIEDASLPGPVGRFGLRGLEGEVEVRPLG